MTLMPAQPTLQDLACRLDALERNNDELRRANRALRRTATVCLGAATLSVAAMLWAAVLAAPAHADGTPEVAKSLRAEQFVLVDAKGKTRAVLGIDTAWPWGDDRTPKEKQTPQPGLYFRDPEGKPKLFMAALADASVLTMLDEGGKGGLVFALSKDRQAMMGINDDKGLTRAVLGVGKDGKPLLLLRGDEALLGLNDLNGVTRVLAGISAGQGAIVVQDKNGKSITQLP
jgi:hypothetical protein